MSMIPDSIQPTPAQLRRQFYAVNDAAFELMKRPDPIAGRLSFQTGSSTVLLRPADIQWFRAERNYIRAYTRFGQRLIRGVFGDDTFTLPATLGNLESQLETVGFCRIHRSILVNVHHLVELRRRSQYWSVVMEDGTELRVSDQYRAAVQQRLSA